MGLTFFLLETSLREQQQQCLASSCRYAFGVQNQVDGVPRVPHFASAGENRLTACRFGVGWRRRTSFLSPPPRKETLA
jgi:hypothetical protein